MRERIEAVIRKQAVRCDYLDVRVEEEELQSVRMRDGEVDGIKRSRSVGGSVRACHKGGWGFGSFNSLDELEAYAARIVDAARAVGDGKTTLAAVEPVDTVLRARFVDDPRGHSMDEKVDLLRAYSQVALGSRPEIKKCFAFYFDSFRVKTFASSEGSYIVQERPDVAIAISPTALGDGLTQSVPVSAGSTNDFGVVLNLDEGILEKCRLSAELLKAPKVGGGIFPVVIDPHLGGVFVHEAFGHTSEADGQVDNPRMVEIFTLGKRFGSDSLTIYDTGLDEGLRGHVPYDDEGVPGRRTVLIREGILEGRLHTRETAGKLGEEATGNGRAMDYASAPICRMRNTCIAPGEARFEDMIADVEEGVYAIGSGGGCGGETFTFSANYGYMIRKGKLAEMVRDVKLQGNLFETLKNIDVVGADFQIHDGPGGCGKMGQFPLPVSHGSPHLRIRNCTVGGEAR